MGAGLLTLQCKMLFGEERRGEEEGTGLCSASPAAYDGAWVRPPMLLLYRWTVNWCVHQGIEAPRKQQGLLTQRCRAAGRRPSLKC